MQELPTKELPLAPPGPPEQEGPEKSAEERLRALAAAIREHEAAQRRQRYYLRHPDVHLYRRLRQICGGSE